MRRTLSKIFAATLLSLGLSAFSQAAQLSISASPNPAQVGQAIGVDVLIDDVQDLYAFQFSLSFDPALLRVDGSSEGSFLSPVGTTFGDPGTIDNGAGALSFAFYTLIGPIPGASGSGVLLHIDFTALAAGTAALSFGDALFLDSKSADIAVTAVPGSIAVTAVPEPASLMLLLVGLGLVAGYRRSQSRGAP